MDPENKQAARVRWFADVGLDDVPEVGGKNASLGEMVRRLSAEGVRVPNGFAVTAAAYRETLAQAGAGDALRDALDGLCVDDVDDLARRARRAREIVAGTPLPPALVDAIASAHAALVAQYGDTVRLAVRSSATAEDLPQASFAGQHESYLNVAGLPALLDAVRNCFASLFTDRALVYRGAHGFDHFKVAQSVGVMKMVRSDIGCSGVAFSLDTESGFRDVVLINGAYGLGELVVKGSVDPDEYYVFKPTLRAGHRAVLRRTAGGKALRMVCAHGTGHYGTRVLQTSAAEQRRFCLGDADVIELAQLTMRIEDHYSARAGHPVPMDVEWAKDGEDGRLYVVQARPETAGSGRPAGTLDRYRLERPAVPLLKGRAVGTRIAAGTARVIGGPADLDAFLPGEVLVAETTRPDWGTVMKKAAAIVTDRGGRTCHAAIVAREMGVPAVVGCGDGTARLATGQAITVSCAEGDSGRVYDGVLPYAVEHTELAALPAPPVPLMVNVGNPDRAFQASQLPVAGVGLARMEFIVAEHIRAHPMALVHPERVADPREREALLRRAADSASPADWFVRELAEGIATIAAAFHPRPVIVRLSDFKSNEYASLPGGAAFEPTEENPMLGLRGAARYTHPRYAEGFALECRALCRVRGPMGLANVRVMVPFCRRVAEAEAVVATLAAHGLRRGEHGLELYLMCEIPNNVVQIDAFARLFDGFSIGSNDLTQLVLGVDRDSAEVAASFDERDPGVMAMIRSAIEGARRNGRHIGICGQAPSDYPDFARFLVDCGIGSISLDPDSVVATIRALAS